ncbi:transcription factor bHLH25-like isoform X2 [Neltuma alba]|uniref:transcription factor bHLH25-like isoform X2 n=1 Tax=Neltuma alba TaxID=207710 RepID=UPI0010A3F6E2|nr:transcription factor bHLH25-like isoform X2 [Prosopis alba]XP_028803365.1 transcription factor bHLH25-like isoform X2 [Prosopis alba]
MDISSVTTLPEQVIVEDPTFLHQWHLNSLDDPSLLPLDAAFGETLEQHSFSNPTRFNPKTSMADTLSGIERPQKHLKPNNWSPNTSDQNQILDTDYDSCSNLLSFVNSSYISQLGTLKPKVQIPCPEINGTILSDMLASHGSLGNQNFVFNASQDARKNVGTSPKLSQPQDHIIAERKRREKLSQRFIALSALVPGLKKTDKASVLGDAIKYLKQLQERVRVLEEEQSRRRSVESVVVVKKTQLLADEGDCSSDSGDPREEPLPEIEARFCDRNVLIRVHCEKTTGVIEKTVSEIEKLHLTVTSTSVMTFGSSALDITIIAQMDKEFCMKLKELLSSLRSAFESFM